MTVAYGGVKLTPGPFIEIKKNFQRAESGLLLKTFFDITVTGKMLAYKGGANWTQSGYPPDTDPAIAADPNKRLALIRDKQRDIIKDFSTDGLWFEIQPFDGSEAIKFQPRITGIDFKEGLWFELFEYTINMEADCVTFGNYIDCGNQKQNVEETWAIEQADDKGRSYRLTHKVSSVAKDTFDPAGNGKISKYGWTLAQKNVLAALGINNTIKNAAGILNLQAYQAYNYVRAEDIDVKGGKYSVTETWLLFSEGIAIEEYTISTKKSNVDGLTTVSIEGTITGLQIRDNTNYTLESTRWQNALAYYNDVSASLLSRAQAYVVTGVTINPLPLNWSVGENVNSGVITYNFEYNNRASTTVANALSEVISIGSVLPSDVFAKIGVLARPLGPIFQDIGSKTESSRTIDIEIVVPMANMDNPHPAKPDVSQVIVDYGPGGTFGFTAVEGPKVSRNQENWVPRTGRYTRNITWEYN